MKVTLIAIAISFMCLFNTNIFAIAPNIGSGTFKNLNATLDMDGIRDDYPYNSYSSDSKKCDAAGENCSLVITANATISQHPIIGNAYLVEIEFVEIASIFGNDFNSNYQHNMSTFKFPEDFKLKVIRCADFPQVEGSVLDLSNKEMNGSNFLTLQIVKND